MAKRKRSYGGNVVQIASRRVEHRKIASRNLQSAKEHARGVLRELAQNECRDAVGELIYMEREFARYKANRSWIGKARELSYRVSNEGPKIMVRARNAFLNKCIVKRVR